MAEYFVLGVWLLIAFVLWGEDSLARYAPHLSVAVGAVYAVTDEVHQTFVPGRSGSIEDVLADLAGLVLAVVTLWLFIGRSSDEPTPTPPSSKD